MAAKRHKSAEQTEKPLSDADLTALDRFCELVEFEEITQACWEDIHADLLIRLPVWLTDAEASRGGCRTLQYSRSVVMSAGGVGKREAVSCEFEFPPAVRDGHEQRLKGLGDIAQDRTGDLIVIVRIKS